MLTQQSAHRKDTNAPLSAELQHRHFAFIAAVINAMPTDYKAAKGAKRDMAMRFADACAGTNPRFDRRRFLLACGYESGE